MAEYKGYLEQKSVGELREMLKPYGTPYRSRLKKLELIRKIREIEQNEKEFGTADPTFQQRLAAKGEV